MIQNHFTNAKSFVEEWVAAQFQNQPQGNMNRIFHELTYTTKVNWKSWLERDSNFKL